MRSKSIFQYTNADFDVLYEVIHKYYLSAGSENDADQDETASNNIGDVLEDNFFNPKHYKERWHSFKLYLKAELKKPVRSVTGFNELYPCFSGVIPVKEVKHNSLTHSKELYFHISFLGPYFTIYGIDQTVVQLSEDLPYYHVGQSNVIPYTATNAITVSPHQEYKLLFSQLESKIRAYFPNIRFIPFEINMIKIQGLSRHTPDIDGKLQDTVFSALFRSDLSLDGMTRGEKKYGFIDWTKKNEAEDSRNQLMKAAILINTTINESEISVHKVWQLAEVTILPSTLGNLMLNIELFEILDLTNKNEATMINNGNVETGIAYTIENNEFVIKSFHNQLVFKIETLTLTELILTLHLNILQDEGKNLKDDVARLRLIKMS